MLAPSLIVEVTTLLVTFSPVSVVATVTTNPYPTPISCTYSPVSTSPETQPPVKATPITQASITTQPSSVAPKTIPSSLSSNNEYSSFSSTISITQNSTFPTALPNEPKVIFHIPSLKEAPNTKLPIPIPESKEISCSFLAFLYWNGYSTDL